MSEEEKIQVEVTLNPEKEPEGEVPVVTPAAGSAGESQAQSTPKKPKPTRTLKDAIEQVEVFGAAVSEALQGRGNVVMVRVNDEALKHLDMLIDAEVTKSRSESAAFLINEGIAANQELFGKISVITQKIAELRDLLRQEVAHQPKEEPKA